MTEQTRVEGVLGDLLQSSTLLRAGSASRLLRDVSSFMYLQGQRHYRLSGKPAPVSDLGWYFFPLRFKLNFLHFSSGTSPLGPSLSTAENSLAPSSLPTQLFVQMKKILLSLLQAGQSQLSALPCSSRAPSSSAPSSSDSLQYVNVPLILGSPGQDLALQLWSPQRWGEEKDLTLNPMQPWRGWWPPVLPEHTDVPSTSTVHTQFLIQSRTRASCQDGWQRRSQEHCKPNSLNT